MPTVTSGSQVYGRDFPPTAYDQEWNNILNISSTTYAAGSPELAVTATAPTSGKVLVCVGCGTRNNAATAERAIVTFRVFQDSADGVEFLAPTENNGVKSNGIPDSDEFRYVGNMKLVTGLTPGRQYYFQVVHRSILGDGTVDISARDIMVIPQP